MILLKAYEFTKNHFNKTRASVLGTNKAGQQTSQHSGRIDVPTLTANIFAAATNRTSIYNKTGGTCH